ncbi:MAG: MXAN_6640 family putative metalloprotease, partial [Chloroflexota bacterium]
AVLLTAFLFPEQAGPVHGRPKTQARPALSGPAQTYSTDFFIIHYTLTGEDAVPLADADNTGRPDYVEAVAEALQFSWEQEVQRLDWRAPLPDRGEGGDPRFDVYLQKQNGAADEGDLFGYAETFGGHIGDNPTTAAIETSAAYGYLSLDNAYSVDEFGDFLDPLDAMRTTAAHELHHAIQAAYDDGDPHEWLYEASATWMEDEVYPQIGDAKSYLADFMDAPDICPLSVGRDDQDVRWYGGWILLRYIAEHYGGPATIRRAWELMATQEGLAALEAALAEQGATLAEVFVDFAVANLAKSNCPANAPYCYVHGRDYLRPYVESSLRVGPGQVEILTPKDGVQPLAADYIRLKSDGPLALDFRGSVAGEWRLRLVGLTGEETSVIDWPATAPARIDPSKFDKLYLVVANTAQVKLEPDCGYHNYTLAAALVVDGQEAQAPQPAADPGPYAPPPLDPETGDDAALAIGEGDPIDAADAPFSLLYPGYVPPGYRLNQVTRRVAADLGDWVDDYAPGGEPVITLEYRGEETETYLHLSQSPAPAYALADWVEKLGYGPHQIRLIYNTPVHGVDYSDEQGLFSVATFMHRDLFVVVEGTFDFIEMQQVVAGVLANNR